MGGCLSAGLSQETLALRVPHAHSLAVVHICITPFCPPSTTTPLTILHCASHECLGAALAPTHSLRPQESFSLAQSDLTSWSMNQLNCGFGGLGASANCSVIKRDDAEPWDEGSKSCRVGERIFWLVGFWRRNHLA